MDYHFTQSTGSFLFRLSNALVAEAYPIASFSYMIVNGSTNMDVSCCQAVELAGFVDEVLEEVDMIEKYHLIPLSSNLASQIKENLLMSLTCEGKNTYQQFVATTQVDEFPQMVSGQPVITLQK